MRSNIQLSSFFVSNDRVSTIIGTRTGVAGRQNHLPDLVRWLAAITLLVVAGFSGQTRAATDIRTAKDPVFVSLPLPSAQSLLLATPTQRAELVQEMAMRLTEASEENPGRLITLDPGRGRLSFRTLPPQQQAVAFILKGDEAPVLYERSMAALLDQTLEAANAIRPNSPVSVLGLPLEPRRALPGSIQDSNDRYQRVIARLAAFVSTRSFVLLRSRVSEHQTVRRGLPEAFRLRQGRPIIFRTNAHWRILFGDSAILNEFDTESLRIADVAEPNDEASAGEDASGSSDELALGETAEGDEETESLLELAEDVVLQHDPFADPSDADSSNGENAGAGVPSLLSMGIGGGGGRASRGGRFGGGGGGGSSGGGGGGASGGGSSGGGLSFDATQSESGSSGSGSNADTGSGGSSSGSGSGGSGSSDDSGSSGGSGSSDSGGSDDSANSESENSNDSGNAWNPDDEFDGAPDDVPPGGGGADTFVPDDPPPDGAPFIPGGNGFSGPTNEPGPIGNPDDPGYDAKAIARWDVVPYQVFDGNFEIGVVAFHMNGIDRVEFSADGGSWTPVSEMTLNPRTNVSEYWAILRASDFEDGEIEVRAIVYPVTGIPRVLGGEYDITHSYLGSEWTGEYSQLLFANAGGTVVEEIVELDAGSYTWGEAPLYQGVQEHQNRWLIYRPAPGVDPSDVIIDDRVNSAPYPRDYKKIKLENLTINGSAALINYYADEGDMIWFDGVTINGPGQWNPDGSYTPAPDQWWTDCYVHDAKEGMARQFVRNCNIERIGEDGIRFSNFVVNVTFDDFDAGDTEWHSGVIGGQLIHHNRIYYNVIMTNLEATRAWPFDSTTNTDVAIIDCDSAQNSESALVFYCGGPTEHLYIRDSRFHGIFAWRLADGVPPEELFQPHNVVLENIDWSSQDEGWVPQPYPMEGVTIR